MNIHANARLTLRARRDVVELMSVGFPVSEIAAQFSVSRQTVYKWAERFQQRQGLDLQSRLADARRQGRPPCPGCCSARWGCCARGWQQE